MDVLKCSRDIIIGIFLVSVAVLYCDYLFLQEREKVYEQLANYELRQDVIYIPLKDMSSLDNRSQRIEVVSDIYLRNGYDVMIEEEYLVLKKKKSNVNN